MDLRQVRAAVDRFDQCTIFVLGDLMVDEYVWGEIERISPEAPVPVLRTVRREHTLGGAGNVVSNLRRLGAEVVVAGVVGVDDAGRLILAQLENQAVEANGVVQDRNRCSTKKTRLMAAGRNQQVFRIDEESTKPVADGIERRILSFVEEKIQRVDALLISDYMKGVVTQAVATTAIEAARARGVPVVVDPKAPYNARAKYAGATSVTPNVREAGRLAGIVIDSEETLRAAGRRLLDELTLESVVITRGADGLSLFANGDVRSIPAEAREVYDVTGAGDTLTAVFTLTLATGAPPEVAARLANTAAGIVVSKLGTTAVDRDELLQDHLRTARTQKIVSPQTLATELARLRCDGKTIVFTNGCFDLLHVGHVRFLNQARTLGNRLIVGLNTDESVRQLKGDGRPIIPQAERASILAGLEAVDYVVLFEEDTPYNLIQLVRPDVLVKGKDYAIDQVVGKDVVESYGGRVELIELVQGVSTTGLLQSIRNQAL